MAEGLVDGAGRGGGGVGVERGGGGPAGLVLRPAPLPAPAQPPQSPPTRTRAPRRRRRRPGNTRHLLHPQPRSPHPLHFLPATPQVLPQVLPPRQARTGTPSTPPSPSSSSATWSSSQANAASSDTPSRFPPTTSRPHSGPNPALLISTQSVTVDCAGATLSSTCTR